MHCGHNTENYKCFTDAVTCAFANPECRGCLVTLSENTVAVMQKNGKYFLFDSHPRHQRWDNGDAVGTAHLRQFKSLESLCEYFFFFWCHMSHL